LGEEQPIVTRARDTAAAVAKARQNLALKEIAAKRVRAQWIPQVVGVAGANRGASGSGVTTDARVGLSLSAPLGVSQWYADQKAATDIASARESLRLQQETVGNEALRLVRTIGALDREVAIRQQALAAARVAVEANLKSYQGGIKSNIDVVTSYQNLADAEVALVNSRLLRVENSLGLRLLMDP
jgi:protease secretion system outer membrane protein